MNRQNQSRLILITLLIAGCVVGLTMAAVPQSTVRTTGAGITTYVGHHGNFTETLNSGNYFLNSVNITDKLRVVKLSGHTAYVGFDVNKTNYVNYFICDETADDVQVAAAVAYAASLGSNGDVFVESGMYHMTARVTIPEQVSIIGTGDSTRFEKDFDGTEVFTLSTTTTEGHILRDFMIDGNSAAQTGSGITISGVSRNVLVDNVRLMMCQEYGIKVINSWGATIQNCLIEYCGSAISKTGTGGGVYINTCTLRFNDLYGVHLNGGNSHRVLNCIIEKSVDQYGSGVRIDQGSYIEISGNAFEDFPTNGKCVFVAGSSERVVGTVITNNKMSENSRLIEITVANDTIIENNQFNGSATAVDVNSGAYRTQIKSNYWGSTTTYNDAGTDTIFPELFVPVNNPNGTLGMHSVIVLTDGAVTTVYSQIYIPTSSVQIVSIDAIIVGNASGNMRRTAYTEFGKLRLSETYNEHTDSLASGQSALTVNELEAVSLGGSWTDVAGGDLIGVSFVRNGDHIDDNVDSACYFLGILVRYLN